MRRRRRLAPLGCAALATLGLALPGCGGGASATPERATARSQGPATTAAARREGGPGARGPSGDSGDGCPASLREFAAGLERLRHRLVAGLTYAEYVGAVKRLRGSYGAIDVERLAPACLIAAGTPAERAFDVYLEAANAWGECLAEAGCDGGDVEASLQAEWKLASRQLDALRLR